MNIEKLGPSSPVRDFEWFIRKEVENLERYAAEMRRQRSRITEMSASSTVRSSITDNDILMGFYFHLESLKSMIEQMQDAEEIIRDMEDDEVEQAYARGELNALKSAFATLAKQVYLSVEKWITLEAQSGRFGRPELHREIFYMASGQQKIASAQPLMYKPFAYDMVPKAMPKF